MTVRCDECRYYWGGVEKEILPECWRYPPTNTQYRSKTKPEWWCGEWELRDELAIQRARTMYETEGRA